MVFSYSCVHLALDNIRIDQLKSAISNLQEIKIVEKTYESIQEEYQGLLNNLEEAIIVFKDDNSIKFANQKFSNLFSRLDFTSV